MSHFDARALEWDSDPQKLERARAVAEAIRKAVPLSNRMNALEYGCGTGLLSFALQADLGEITLADSSQGMLDVVTAKIAAAGVTNMHSIRLDLSIDPPPASRYQLAYSLMTLHHIPDTQDILRKLHALLDPGGILLIADLDREDGTFHAHGGDYAHNGFERANLQSQVEMAGFDNVSFCTAYEMKKRVREVERTYPVFLMSSRKSAWGTGSS